MLPIGTHLSTLRNRTYVGMRLAKGWAREYGFRKLEDCAHDHDDDGKRRGNKAAHRRAQPRASRPRPRHRSAGTEPLARRAPAEAPEETQAHAEGPDLHAATPAGPRHPRLVGGRPL